MWTNENWNGLWKSLLTILEGDKRRKRWFSGLNKSVLTLKLCRIKRRSPLTMLLRYLGGRYRKNGRNDSGTHRNFCISKKISFSLIYPVLL